jgi:hypothetical protein
MALALCVECQARPRRTPHANTKYCAPCRERLLRMPRSRVTSAQGQQIAALRGTIARWQIAERVGISHAQLNRYLAEQGLASNARDYPPEIVTAVCATYAALGKRRTQDLFPDVVVRCVIERHKDYPPRQVRWTGAQQMEVVRMGGLVSHTAQVRYFGRPNAYEGSIKKFWERVVGCAPRDVHGLGVHQVWRLTTPGVTAVLIHQATQPGPRAIVLWLDLTQHLRPGVTPEVRQMVEVLARFQAWLFGSTDPARIRRMIQEREAYARDDHGAEQWPPAHPASPFAFAGGDL